MSFTKVAPAGIGTEPGTSIRIGDSLLHSTGIDIGTGTGIGVTIRKHGHATFTGIITASSFSGSGANLTSLPAANITGTLPALDGSNLIGVASTDNIKTSTTANFTGGIQVGGATTFTGDVGIAGTLTYEDVTNVDSVGVITARSGLKVLAGGANVVGIVSISAGTNNEGLRITGQHNNCVIFTSPSINSSAGYRLNHHPSTNFLRVDTTDQNGAFTSTVAKFSTAGLDMADNIKLRLGSNQDLTLYHYGNDAYIDNADGDIIFRQGTSEKLRIDSSGRIGIGNDLTNTYDSTYHQICIGNGANANNGMLFHVGTSSGTYIGFKDTTDSTVQGIISYTHSNDAMGFRTNGTERLRITSDGDTELRNDVAGINDSYSQYLKFRTTQSNGQSAITGAIRAQGKSNWGGDLVLYSKPANGSPNDTTNEIMRLHASGETTFNGNINLSGSATATNQNRQIYFTGFDKEATSDVSDYAYIRHTTNVHGITGSVLELRAENDATDGIALHAGSGNGQIAFAGKIRGNIQMHEYGGYIRPSYGTGDKGIYWQPDPAGGSGDYAHIQYYTDGSGEDTRLRIQIANDAQDDLRLEGPTVRIQGSFSKSSGSFRIPHVLSGLTTTTDLIHSFVEGPQADNLYRGRTTLVAGISTVNIDTTNNMTEGTFVNLNRDVQCFTTNETGWTAIKGSVTGNLLTIVAQDNTCTDTISWMVIGERWDLAMYDPTNPMTDANGKVKTEIPNNSYNKGGGYEEDYISENRHRVGISTFFRPSIENKEVE